MTRAEFVERYRHQLSGSILDVLFREAKGGELSLLIRSMLRQVDQTLGAAFDELTREHKAAPANGAPQPVRKT